MVLDRLFYLDRQIVDWVAEQRLDILTELFLEVTALGSLTFAVVIILGLWLLGNRDSAVLLTAGVFLVGAVVKTVKWVTARDRPDVIYEGVINTSLYAFPSGHSALAFVMAVILSHRYPAAKIYFFLLAVLVMASRVYLGVHFVTDVFIGAGVGVAAGWLVVRYQELILERVHQVYR